MLTQNRQRNGILNELIQHTCISYPDARPVEEWGAPQTDRARRRLSSELLFGAVKRMCREDTEVRYCERATLANRASGGTSPRSPPVDQSSFRVILHAPRFNHLLKSSGLSFRLAICGGPPLHLMFHNVSTGTRDYAAQPILPEHGQRWEFVAVLQGRIAPIIPDHPQPFATSTLWVFRPGCLHGWTGEPGRTARVAELFGDSVPEAIKEEIPPCGFIAVPLTPDDRGAILKAVKMILPHMWKRDKLLPFVSQRVLMELTILILQKLGNLKSSRSVSTVMNAAEDFLRSHLSTRPDFDSLCGIMGLSESQIRRLFKRHRQRTPIEVMAAFQMERACDLLLSTDLKIEAVALECGYTHISTFYAAFREAKGLSPGEFREQHRSRR